ncbi:MAG: polymer-forming cytoskeletal protein [Pseudomonadales bacterium]
MFKKSEKSAPKKNSGVTTLVAEGTEILGDIRFSGNLEIEGCVKGNIIAAEGAESAMRIMESGRVEGDVYVPHVVINGNVTGEVHSSKYIELASKAHVEGNVHYNIIEMVRGAQVNGNLIYNSAYSEEAPKGKRSTPSDELKFGANVDKKGSGSKNMKGFVDGKASA